MSRDSKPPALAAAAPIRGALSLLPAALVAAMLHVGCSAGSRQHVDVAEPSAEPEPAVQRRAPTALDAWLLMHEPDEGLLRITMALISQAESPGAAVLHAPLSPAKRCCEHPGGMCPGSSAEWQLEPWKALRFDVTEPHRFQYEVVARDEGLVARAVADLECDGELLIFEQTFSRGATAPMRAVSTPDEVYALPPLALYAALVAELSEEACWCTDAACFAGTRRSISKAIGQVVFAPLASFAAEHLRSAPLEEGTIGASLERARPCLARLRAEQARALGPPPATAPMTEGLVEAWGEASRLLATLFRSSAAFYVQEGPDPAPARFPAPAPPTPSKACCASPGGRCPGGAAEWDAQTWQDLNFALNDPHLLQFEFLSDEGSFTVRATGDPGCTGRTLTFERSGTVTEEGHIQGSRGMSATLDDAEVEMSTLAFDALEAYARRLCGAPEGATLDHELEAELAAYDDFRQGAESDLDEVLSGARPPEGAHETRLLEVYEQLSLCWTALTVAELLRSDDGPEPTTPP